MGDLQSTLNAYSGHVSKCVFLHLCPAADFFFFSMELLNDRIVVMAKIDGETDECFFQSLSSAPLKFISSVTEQKSNPFFTPFCCCFCYKLQCLWSRNYFVQIYKTKHCTNCSHSEQLISLKVITIQWLHIRSKNTSQMCMHLIKTRGV